MEYEILPGPVGHFSGLPILQRQASLSIIEKLTDEQS